MIIDTHAHLSFPEFKDDLATVIARAKSVGVAKIINVGCDLKSSQDAVSMLKTDPCLYATLGMHPYEAGFVDGKLMGEWEKIIENDKNSEKRIVAIGECGLDYFKAKVPKDVQKRAFQLQLRLAVKMDLPVIVHNRDADEDSLSVLVEMEKEVGKSLRVVFHCYASDLDFAKKLWAKGYLTSFTGVVTYPSALNVHEVAREVPEELFMVETDCPYLAPQAYRGKRNEPSFVTQVVGQIARLKRKNMQEIAEISTRNAERFFGV